MKDLLETLKIIQKSSARDNTFNYLEKIKETKSHDKLGMFLIGLNNNEYKSDIDACLKLYGVESSPKYYMLKSRMKKLLLEILYLSKYKLPDEGNIDNVSLKLQKLLVIGQHLYEEHHFTMALEVYRYIFKTSGVYHLYSIAVSCFESYSKVLIHLNKKKEFEQASSLLKEYHYQQNIELDLYHAIQTETLHRNEGMDRRKAYVMNSERLIFFQNAAAQSANPNFKIDVLKYEYILTAADEKNHHPEKIFTEWINLIRNNNFLIFKKKEEGVIVLILNYALENNDLDKAESIFQEYTEFSHTDMGWYFYYFLKTCFELRKNHFHEACTILGILVSHPLYKDLPDMFVEYTTMLKRIVEVGCISYQISGVHSLFSGKEKKPKEVYKTLYNKECDFIYFLEVIHALCTRNIALASSYLNKLKTLPPHNSSAATKRLKIAFKALKTFTDGIKTPEQALEDSKKIIEKLYLKPGELLDSNEHIPYWQYWEFIELVYAHASPPKPQEVLMQLSPDSHANQRYV